MKAIVIHRQKAEIQERYIVEIVINDVGVSHRYPDGIKYGLVCFDKKTNRKVLLDNHDPKGHHIHINNMELPYEFTTMDKLVEDFEKLVLDNLGVKL